MEMNIHQSQGRNVNKEKMTYTSLVQTDDFQELLKRKKAFILPMTLFFFGFYFLLPLLAAYTKVLTYEVIGSISLAWIYALLQFVLVWVCGIIYIKKSEKYDKLADTILVNYKEEL